MQIVIFGMNLVEKDINILDYNRPTMMRKIMNQRSWSNSDVQTFLFSFRARFISGIRR